MIYLKIRLFFSIQAKLYIWTGAPKTNPFRMLFFLSSTSSIERPTEVNHVMCMNERLLVLLKKKKKKNREISTRNDKGQSPGIRRKEEPGGLYKSPFDDALLTEQLLLSSGLASPCKHVQHFQILSFFERWYKSDFYMKPLNFLILEITSLFLPSSHSWST